MDWILTPVNMAIFGVMAVVLLIHLLLISGVIGGAFQQKANWIQQLNSVYTVLGVLGTFLGIFIGLQDFNVDDITNSIPRLLEGMKTAFATSIAGISLSLVMSLVARGWHNFGEARLPSPMEIQNEKLDSILGAMQAQKSALQEAMTQVVTQSKTMVDLQKEQNYDVTAIRKKLYQEENKDVATLRDAIGRVLEALNASHKLLEEVRKSTSETTVQATRSNQLLDELESIGCQACRY